MFQVILKGKVFLFFSCLSSPFLLAEELPTKYFLFCSQKRATGITVRTIRVHYFLKEKKCLTVYSKKGKDEILAQGKWLSFCKKIALQVQTKLKEQLWDCKEQASSLVFYSEEGPHIKTNSTQKSL